MLADLPPASVVIDTSAHADVVVNVNACPLLDLDAEAKLALHLDVDA